MDLPQTDTTDTLLSERDTIDLDVGDDTGRRYSRMIIDRNPFFLLSGLSMFAGCFLVSREIHATDPSEAGFVGMLVGLIVVMNIYEAAVIALGIALSRSASLVRDSRHLLGLGLLLMIDVAFVYNETATADLALGATLAGLAGVLAVGKLLLITRLIGVRLEIVPTIVLNVTLLSLYAMPVTLRMIASDGFVPLPAMLGLWTVIGLIVGGYAIPKRWTKTREARNPDHQQLQKLVRLGVIGLPVVSLLAHAAMGLWVYGTQFTPTLLCPVILGFAAVVLSQHIRLGGIRPAMHATMLLLAAAVIASIQPPTELMLILDPVWFSLSPLRGTLLIGSLMLGWVWWLAGGLAPLVAGGSMITAMLLGPRPSAMWANLADATRWITELLPETRLGWGIAAVGLAFALLVVGSAVSWWRHRDEQKRRRAIDLLSGSSV